jgi:hypothetical protein
VTAPLLRTKLYISPLRAEIVSRPQIYQSCNIHPLACELIAANPITYAAKHTPIRLVALRQCDRTDIICQLAYRNQSIPMMISPVISVLANADTPLSTDVPAEISFVEHELERGFTRVSDIDVTDLDGDGDKDILGVALTLGKLAWWRNDGGDPLTWTKEVISAELFGAWGLFVADIDSDGDIDVFWWRLKRDHLVGEFVE